MTASITEEVLNIEKGQKLAIRLLGRRERIPGGYCEIYQPGSRPYDPGLYDKGSGQ